MKSMIDPQLYKAHDPDPGAEYRGAPVAAFCAVSHSARLSNFFTIDAASVCPTDKYTSNCFYYINVSPDLAPYIP